MNFYEILLNRGAVGEGMTHFERLFAQKIGSGVKELSGVPPLTFKANGQPLIDWSMTGQTVQASTPTPSSPVAVEGVGTLSGSDYIIPITCGGTTTNIYLGSATSTRRVKKLVLTGEEDYPWYRSLTRNYSWYIHTNTIGTIMNTPFYCSHGETVTNVSDYGYGKVYCDNTFNLGIFDSSIDTRGKLNNYFAQQYANGTPVTIWYVLAAPETAATNEPLMKIGTYADELTKTGTGVNIPTTKGNNTLTVNTTIQPSNMYIKYHT